MPGRLVMFEGLPGTGKSSNSFFSFIQLERSGQRVQWVHEVAHPHPFFVYGEAIFTYAEYRAFLNDYPQAEPALTRLAVYRKNTVGIDFLTFYTRK